MAAAVHIAVLDDEADITRLIATYLQAQGFRVSQTHDGATLLRLMGDDPAQLVLLDLGLPGEDGFALARELRERWRCGLVIVTGRGDAVDKVVGLEVGADDYVTKPFSPRELLARIRATVRRVRGQAGPTQQTVQVGGLVLDPQKMTVTLDGNPIDVTAYEFSILRALAQRPGRVLSREQLLDLAKGSAELSFDRSIDVHVSRLRAKLGDDSRNPKILKTVRGAGYLLAGGDV